MRTKFAFTLLLTSSLTVGCKPSPSPAPPAPKTVAAAPVTDSCAILTPAEISGVLGIPIDPGKHTLATSDIMCNWAQTGTPQANALRLVLNFSSLDAYNREKNAKGNVKVTSAPGIGDDAIYVTSQFGTSLLLRKGNRSIGFSIRNMPLAADQEMAKERVLGLDAAARL